MATIRDIAKLSGYSVSSVSRVLNKHPHVSEEARQKIEAIIEELDYKPNVLAQELSAGKTYKIGVIMPQTRRPYFTQLLTGLLDQARKTHYSLLILPSDYNAERERDFLEQLRGHAFDGLIFTSRSIALTDIAKYSSYDPILVCEPTKEKGISSLYLNRRPAYLQAYQWLKNQNLSHLALLFTRGDNSSATFKESLAAFHDSYGKSKAAQIYSGISTYEDGYAIGKRLCQKAELDVIFANSDDVAAGVKQAYQETKRKLPLLLGQEKQLSGQLLGIATIDHKAYELGQACITAITSGEIQTKEFQSEFLPR